jgi:hypothetical protein
MFSNGRPRRDRGKFRDFDPLKNLSGRFHHPVKRARRKARKKLLPAIFQMTFALFRRRMSLSSNPISP